MSYDVFDHYMIPRSPTSPYIELIFSLSFSLHFLINWVQIVLPKYSYIWCLPLRIFNSWWKLTLLLPVTIKDLQFICIPIPFHTEILSVLDLCRSCACFQNYLSLYRQQSFWTWKTLVSFSHLLPLDLFLMFSFVLIY